jgi:hypothetical protein
MFRTLHKVEIDFASVPYRACRPFQEKLSTDYGQNGKLLFEWDKMRERFYVHGLPAILNTCTPCPMNVFGGIEGCKGEVEGLTTFLKVLMHLKPDSSIFKHRFQNEYMVHDETRTFIAELHRVVELMASSEWPIAQVLMNGYAKEVDGPRGFMYYEWEGDEDETFIFSNDGYSVGIAKDGLVVKDASGARQPFYFTSLSRTQTRVVGETGEGQSIAFDPVRDCQPAWDEEPEYVDTELVFTRVMASDLFSDVLQVFSTCGEIALKHNTGLRIQLLS